MIGAITVPLTSFAVPASAVIIGLISGCVYALLGIGLALTYRSTRVINLAFGEMGAAVSAVFVLLVLNVGMPYWLAIVTALTIAVLLGGAIEIGVIRPLRNSSRLIAMVATIGVSQLLFALESFLPDVHDSQRATYPVPFDATLMIGSLRLQSGYILILIVVPVVVLALFGILRRTRFGLEARAGAENFPAALLAGIRARRVSLTVWCLTGLLAGIAGVLLGPEHPMETKLLGVSLGPGLMFRALAAAMIGGMTNFPLIAVGGLVVGLGESILLWNNPNSGNVDLAIFIVVVGCLLLQRRLGRAARGGEEASWSLGGVISALPTAITHLPAIRALKVLSAAVAIIAAFVVPEFFSDTNQIELTNVVVMSMVALSIVVLTGYAGQVSLGQFAFVGLGALLGGLCNYYGYPPVAGVLAAAGGGAAAAALVGLPALRIRGVFLAVTTLGFAVASSSWLFNQRWLVPYGHGLSSLYLPRPAFLGVNLQNELYYYWLALAVLVIVIVLLRQVRRSGLGRALIAVRDNELAAASMGVVPWRTKLIAFVLSGIIAAVAGYLYAGLLVDYSSLSIFGPDVSILILTTAVIGGVTTVTGALLGAILIIGLPAFIGLFFANLLGSQASLLLSGAGVLVILVQNPSGLAGSAFRARDALVAWLARRTADIHPAPISNVAPPVHLVGQARERPPSTQANREVLSARGIELSYGGLRVLNGVSLSVRHGEIVGLLGPNGAGKTSLFDVLSGHIQPSAGVVELHGIDVTRLRPDQRARRGLGRSFQSARLFETMTVTDALSVALERQYHASAIGYMAGSPRARSAERAKRYRATQILEMLGMEAYADRRVGELSTGMRRIAELGCLIGLGTDIILLDEPTAGIAQREVEQFAPLLRDLRSHLDASMVIIEHDVPLVLDLADRVCVLSAGDIVAEGRPAEIRSSPRVREALLGTDERLIQRSGPLASQGITE